MREELRKVRDKETEKVINRLEAETTKAQEQLEAEVHNLCQDRMLKYSLGSI